VTTCRELAEILLTHGDRPVAVAVVTTETYDAGTEQVQVEIVPHDGALYVTVTAQKKEN
jgi:hypothetical protein